MTDTYPKLNYLQRPGISGKTDSHDSEERMPGAFPEDEGIATEIIHGVGHLFHDVEERVKAYVPAPIGTYLSYSNPNESSPEKFSPEESSSKESNHPKPQSTHKLKDALHQVQGDAAATDSQTPSTLVKPSLDVPLSESFRSMKISGNPTTLPSPLENKYYRSAMTHDADDPLDLSHEHEVPFVDISKMVIPGRQGEEWPYEARDRASDCARGGYIPGDGSEPVDRGYGEGDVAVGYGGVTYNRSGRGDVLPGYPTPEGIAKLVFDRMVDDQIRLAGVENPTSVTIPGAAIISKSNNSSEGYPTSLPAESTGKRHDMPASGSGSGEEMKVPCQERRTTSSAPDKFETTYRPVTSRSGREDQNPTSPSAIPRSTNGNNSGVSPITVRSLPAESTENDIAVRNGDSDSGLGFLPETRSVHFPKETPVNVNGSKVSDGATCMSSSVEAGTIGGLQVGYLGKPISESELYTY